MKFTTPCFVRIKDAKKRKKLIEWLLDIGYRAECPIDYLSTIVLAGWLEDNVDTTPIFTVECLPDYMIDCGSNIELFKALAAMNDENNYYQWFVCTSDYWSELKPGDMIRNDGPKDYRLFFEPLFRKATPAQLIEYFSKK